MGRCVAPYTLRLVHGTTIALTQKPMSRGTGKQSRLVCWHTEPVYSLRVGFLSCQGGSVIYRVCMCLHVHLYVRFVLCSFSFKVRWHTGPVLNLGWAFCSIRAGGPAVNCTCKHACMLARKVCPLLQSSSSAAEPLAKWHPARPGCLVVQASCSSCCTTPGWCSSTARSAGRASRE